MNIVKGLDKVIKDLIMNSEYDEDVVILKHIKDSFGDFKVTPIPYCDLDPCNLKGYDVGDENTIYARYCLPDYVPDLKSLEAQAHILCEKLNGDIIYNTESKWFGDNNEVFEISEEDEKIINEVYNYLNDKELSKFDVDEVITSEINHVTIKDGRNTVPTESKALIKEKVFEKLLNI